jgi:hypothetical protein
VHTITGKPNSVYDTEEGEEDGKHDSKVFLSGPFKDHDYESL